MRFSDNNGGGFQLDSFPGNSQIVVLTGDFIHPEKRGKGLGKQLHKMKVDTAKDLGYDLLTCTVVSSNEAQIKIVLRNGWEELTRFKSKKTGNEIILFAKHL